MVLSIFCFVSFVFITSCVWYRIGYNKRANEDQQKIENVIENTKEILVSKTALEESDAFETFSWDCGDSCAESILNCLKDFVKSLVKESYYGAVYFYDMNTARKVLREVFRRYKNELIKRITK